MTQDEISQQERFGRILAFADGRAGDFPLGKPAGANVEILRDVQAQLRVLGGEQVGSKGQAMGATGRKSAVLDALRADLVGLAKVARELEDEYPSMKQSFKMPSNARDDSLLNAARAQLGLLTEPDSGATLAALFMDYGMPDDFVSQMQGDIVDAEGAVGSQDSYSGERREDTLAIDAQIEIGIRAVGKLDAYCENKYRADSTLLGAWKTASHLERIRVHRTRTV